MQVGFLPSGISGQEASLSPGSVGPQRRNKKTPNGYIFASIPKERASNFRIFLSISCDSGTVSIISNRALEKFET